MGSIEPRFLVEWANGAFLDLQDQYTEQGRELAGPTSLNASAVASGLHALHRYVRDEVSNDHWRLWPDVQFILDRMLANGRTNRSDLAVSLGKAIMERRRLDADGDRRVTDKGDGQAATESYLRQCGERALRRIHYLGVLGPEDFELSTRARMPYVFCDALRTGSSTCQSTDESGDGSGDQAPAV